MAFLGWCALSKKTLPVPYDDGCGGGGAGCPQAPRPAACRHSRFHHRRSFDFPFRSVVGGKNVGIPEPWQPFSSSCGPSLAHFLHALAHRTFYATECTFLVLSCGFARLLVPRREIQRPLRCSVASQVNGGCVFWHAVTTRAEFQSSVAGSGARALALVCVREQISNERRHKNPPLNGRTHKQKVLE